jgi:hypothetical protein
LRRLITRRSAVCKDGRPGCGALPSGGTAETPWFRPRLSGVVGPARYFFDAGAPAAGVVRAFTSTLP